MSICNSSGDRWRIPVKYITTFTTKYITLSRDVKHWLCHICSVSLQVHFLFVLQINDWHRHQRTSNFLIIKIINLSQSNNKIYKTNLPIPNQNYRINSPFAASCWQCYYKQNKNTWKLNAISILGVDFMQTCQPLGDLECCLWGGGGSWPTKQVFICGSIESVMTFSLQLQRENVSSLRNI